ncbi:jg7610 [Pararge aegeria aegeria]|uniref:Jg7610 protein n=1 Tax=Pararge aegeria aegeria TaxID=348720 RepID=A0A8S4RJ39_9NEOP|nr:jg7610 [Pararge aegeria aegeria]
MGWPVERVKFASALSAFIKFQNGLQQKPMEGVYPLEVEISPGRPEREIATFERVKFASALSAFIKFQNGLQQKPMEGVYPLEVEISPGRPEREIATC